MIDTLVFGLIAWGIYFFITKQKSLSRPEDVAKRPRWLFALLLALVFFMALSQPLTGSIGNSPPEKAIVFRLLMFLMYSSLPILAYLLYKLKFWLSTNKQPKKVKTSASPKQAIESIESNPDADLYLQAANEVDNNNQKPALWAKAMALCEGDENKAKYKYINLRVDELANPVKQEVTPHSIQSSTLEHDPKDTDSEPSFLFLKEKGFNITQKDGKWVFIDALGESREFSTKGLVALANSKGFSDSFKENKLTEINLQRSKKFLEDKDYLVIKKNYGWLVQGGLENIMRLNSDDELFAYAVKKKGFNSVEGAKFYLKKRGFSFTKKDYGWQVLEPLGGLRKLTTDDEIIKYANSKETPLE